MREIIYCSSLNAFSSLYNLKTIVTISSNQPLFLDFRELNFFNSLTEQLKSEKKERMRTTSILMKLNETALWIENMER